MSSENNQSQNHSFDSMMKLINGYESYHDFINNTEDVNPADISIIDGYWQEWEYINSENSNTDDKLSGSTTFFALVLSSLITIGFATNRENIWFILSPLITMVLISLVLLIMAMNPSPTSRSIKNTCNTGLFSVLRKHVEWKSKEKSWQSSNSNLFEKTKKEFIEKEIYKLKSARPDEVYFEDWSDYFLSVHIYSIMFLDASIRYSIDAYVRHKINKRRKLTLAYITTFPWILFFKIKKSSQEVHKPSSMAIEFKSFSNPNDYSRINEYSETLYKGDPIEKFGTKKHAERLAEVSAISEHQCDLMMRFFSDRFSDNDNKYFID